MASKHQQRTINKLGGQVTQSVTSADIVNELLWPIYISMSVYILDLASNQIAITDGAIQTVLMGYYV